MVFKVLFTMQFYDLYKRVCFLSVKVKSKEICEEIFFPSLFLYSRLIVSKKYVATPIFLYGFQ